MELSQAIKPINCTQTDASIILADLEKTISQS
jgi:hypothetical protein